MARKVLKKKQQQDEQHDDRKPTAISSPHQPEMELNSSDEEQQKALGSLWTSMTQEDDKNESDEEETPNDPTIFAIGITMSWDLMHHGIWIYKTFIILVRHVLWAKMQYKRIY
jgi:hypothetical protein